MRPLTTALLTAAALSALPACAAHATVRVGHSESAIAVTDLNGDGAADVAARSDRRILIRLGDGRGGFRAPARGSIAFRQGAGYLVALDVDRDGDPDLAADGAGPDGADRDTSTVAVFLGDGRGGFRAAPGRPIIVPGSTNSLLPARIDRGPENDLVALTSGGHLYPLLGDRRGGLRLAPRARGNFCPQCTTGASVDLDGDRFTDVVAAKREVAGAYLGGTGSGLMRGAPGGRSGRHPHGLAVADLDGDRHLDAAITDKTIGKLRFLRGDGTGALRAAGLSQKLDDDMDVGSTLRPGDFNGDGRADLATSASIYLGDGRFGLTRVARLAGALRGTGDVNRDGRADVVVEPASGSLAVQLAGTGGRLGPARPVLAASSWAPSER